MKNFLDFSLQSLFSLLSVSERNNFMVERFGLSQAYLDKGWHRKEDMIARVALDLEMLICYSTLHKKPRVNSTRSEVS